MSDVGIHNSDLKKSGSRIIESGTWKKQRVIVVVPAAQMIHARVYLSHLSLVFPPNNGVYRILAQETEVGDAYSMAVEQVLANSDLSQWEYVLCVEHDNLPPADGVLKLVKRMEEHPEFAAIGGLYWTKGEGGVPQCWGDPKDPVLNFRPQAPRPGELMEVCGTGMGFTLYRLSMFKDPRLRKPWFKTQAGSNGVATQDLYFWSDARKHGYRCAIDCNVLVGHLDLNSGVIW